MKQKLKKANSNKPICSKNNNEHVGAGFMPAHTDTYKIDEFLI